MKGNTTHSQQLMMQHSDLLWMQSIKWQMDLWQQSKGTMETTISMCLWICCYFVIFILPIMLYGSECWTVTKADAQRIDATDQWCLCRILDIRWNDFVRNEEVRRLTEQPPLSFTVKSRRLSLFGHLARMDEYADANWVLFEQLPENWRRLPGRPRSTWIQNITDDLSPFDMGLPEARDAAQNRTFWRMFAKHGATHP